jgi:hypothetical protein
MSQKFLETEIDHFKLSAAFVEAKCEVLNRGLLLLLPFNPSFKLLFVPPNLPAMNTVSGYWRFSIGGLLRGCKAVAPSSLPF